MISVTSYSLIVKEYGKHNKDTGSCETQIAFLTNRISNLADHFKSHKHDQHSKYGLLKMVSKRRNLLSRLKYKDYMQYKEVIYKLDLRK